MNYLDEERHKVGDQLVRHEKSHDPKYQIHVDSRGGEEVHGSYNQGENLETHGNYVIGISNLAALPVYEVRS